MLRLLTASVVLLEYLEQIKGGERNAAPRNCLVWKRKEFEFKFPVGNHRKTLASGSIMNLLFLSAMSQRQPGKSWPVDRILSVAKYAGDSRFVNQGTG
jgi:hypothetical protein